MPLKQAADLVKGYRAAFGIGAEDIDALPARVGETISPVMDIWSTPEWHLLRGSLLGVGYEGAAAGGAGTRAMVQLWNPATSDRLAVCTHVLADAPAVVSVDQNELAHASTAYGCRDLRKKRAWTASIDTELRCSVRWDNTFGKPGTSWDRQLIITAGVVYLADYILPPGHGIAVDPKVDNTAINAQFWWYERLILPGERIQDLR